MSDANDIEVKTEPVDIADPPKDFLVPGTTFAEDGECEDLQYFTQVEVDNTRKCLENTRLIIKDFETQLDWHLQQYITLRNIFSKKADGSKRQDLLSISQLSAIIANHPEGNKKFIKRKGPVSNGGAGRKRRRTGKKGKDSEEEETEEEDEEETEDSEDYDEEDSDSENEDNPKRTRGAKKGDVQVKDEIEEEYNELVVPKEEPNSDEDEDDFDEDEMDDDDFDEDDYEEEPPKKGKGKAAAATASKKTPAKKAPAPKKTPVKAKATPAKATKAAAGAKKGAAAKAKTPAKGKGRGKNKQAVNDEDEDMPEIKDEIDSNEISEKLQNKFIFDLDEFEVDEEKPIILLTDENYKTFDWNEVKLNNVIITFDEQFPDFIFSKDVAKNILNDNIKVVEVGVFDMYNDAKN